jgi:hypothetical protein
MWMRWERRDCLPVAGAAGKAVAEEAEFTTPQTPWPRDLRAASIDDMLPDKRRRP